MRRPRFRTIEHTSDVGLLAWGDDFAELCENAAAGMFYLMFPGVKEPGRGNLIRVRSTGFNREELLVGWLRELLFLCNVRGWFLGKFRVEAAGDGEIAGRCLGVRVPPGRQTLEIKLVTYHGLRVEKSKGRLRARVIFDV